jgi:hypothetical protein
MAIILLLLVSCSGRGHEPFRKGISHERIPPDLAVAKNLGFAPLNPRESPINLLNPEFLATSLCRNRYPLEKRVMASKKNRLAESPAMPALLNISKILGSGLH